MGILFPIETWRTIFASLCTRSRAEIIRDMLSLASTCTAFQYEAELILYQHVLLTRGIAQLVTFATAITRYTERSLAVRVLHMQLRSEERERSEEVAKIIFQRLPNLVSLYIDNFEDPHGVLIDVPFRLRSFVLDGDAFVCLHAEERRRRLRANQGRLRVENTTSFRCDFLFELTTLTLFDPSIQLTARLEQYSAPYHITHLNIVSSPMGAHMGAMRALAGTLVSLRISPAPLPTSNYLIWCTRASLEMWPTIAVEHHVFPRLEFFELDQDDYDQLRLASNPHTPFNVEDWRASCPAIRIFVWRPAPAYTSFARESEWYRGAICEFTERLFEEWTTLQRFERAALELETAPNEEGTYAAYTRVEDGLGSIVAGPAEYDGELWHRV